MPAALLNHATELFFAVVGLYGTFAAGPALCRILRDIAAEESSEICSTLPKRIVSCSKSAVVLCILGRKVKNDDGF